MHGAKLPASRQLVDVGTNLRSSFRRAVEKFSTGLKPKDSLWKLLLRDYVERSLTDKALCPQALKVPLAVEHIGGFGTPRSGNSSIQLSNRRSNRSPTIRVEDVCSTSSAISGQNVYLNW
jgi:hypothetical protein